MKVRQSLNLADRPMIKKGYATLLAEYLEQHGLHEREVKFSGTSGLTTRGGTARKRAR